MPGNQTGKGRTTRSSTKSKLNTKAVLDSNQTQSKKTNSDQNKDSEETAYDRIYHKWQTLKRKQDKETKETPKKGKKKKNNES